jgi:hypothetical protein
MLYATKMKRFKVVRYIADSSKVLYATKVNSDYFVAFRNLSEAPRDYLFFKRGR